MDEIENLDVFIKFKTLGVNFLLDSSSGVDAICWIEN